MTHVRATLVYIWQHLFAVQPWGCHPEAMEDNIANSRCHHGCEAKYIRCPLMKRFM